MERGGNYNTYGNPGSSNVAEGSMKEANDIDVMSAREVERN
jgi:hypothetical protein